MTEKQLQPTMMVTHNWANRFRDLCAAIVADALGQDEYSTVAGLLDSNPSKLEAELFFLVPKKGWGQGMTKSEHQST